MLEVYKKKMIFKGMNNLKVYSGIDMKTNEMVNANIGDEIEVSEDKATQLLADFPEAFQTLDSQSAAIDPVQQSEEGKKSKRKK